MKRARWLLVGLLASVVFIPVPAHADVNDFTVDNFTSDQTLSRADRQGQLRIVEHINVTFTDNNHGILRAIPDRYKDHSLQLHINRVSSDSGAPAGYTTYGSNGNTVLKIGDPNRTVTGAQEYTIDYTVRNVITFYGGHDELYWNVNGGQWGQPFEKVSVTVRLPAGLRLSLPPTCYTGLFGATDHNCTTTTPDSTTIQTITTAPLPAGQSLTYTASFEPGYFTPSRWYETAWEYHPAAFRLLAPVLVLSGISIVWWWRRGRDPKGSGVIIPQYDAPDGLRPLQVGVISDFSADNRDITATIVDLAIRGYIVIQEIAHDKGMIDLFADKKRYTLLLSKEDIGGLNDYEQTILQALFDPMTKGSSCDLSKKKNKLVSTATSVRKQVEGDLTSAGYFRSNPLKAGKVLATVFSIPVIVVWFWGKYLDGPFAVGLFIGGTVALFVVKFMSARTVKGVAAEEHIKGLKMYLEVAEKDRLEKLQSPNAPYAEKTEGPARTVKLFEKLLPYAIVLGVEKQWAGQFKDLYAAAPGWYAGSNMSGFNTGYLVGNLNSGLGGSVNAAFAAPRSSGGAGGGAGGGGGGGGGGGW